MALSSCFDYISKISLFSMCRVYFHKQNFERRTLPMLKYSCTGKGQQSSLFVKLFIFIFSFLNWSRWFTYFNSRVLFGRWSVGLVTEKLQVLIWYWKINVRQYFHCFCSVYPTVTVYQKRLKLRPQVNRLMVQVPWIIHSPI